MKKMTLCFLLDGDRICLAKKKRGFGSNKLNGVGGKVEPGETLLEAAVREIQEEIGVKTKMSALEERGSITFYFARKPEWTQQVFVFVTRNWQGIPTESEEMAPRWYHTSQIPYDKMWIDDPYWLPKVLDGKSIRGEFYFNEEGTEISRFTIEEEERITT